MGDVNAKGAAFRSFTDTVLRRADELNWPFDEAVALVSESFDYDLDKLGMFLDRATGTDTEFPDGFYADPLAASYDITTLVQLPAVLGLKSTDPLAVEWSVLFSPYTLDGTPVMYPAPSDFKPRASFWEMRAVLDAGVPLEYAQAADPGPLAPYPAAAVVECFESGVSAEYVSLFAG